MKNKMKVRDHGVTPHMPGSAGSRAPIKTPVEGLHTTPRKVTPLSFKPTLSKSGKRKSY